MQRHVTIIYLSVALLLLILAGVVQAEPSQITGDVPADFDQPDTVIIEDPGVGGDPGEDDVAGDDLFPQQSGWELIDVQFDYDATTDIMYMGVNCATVCGDANGDGDPDTGTLDEARLNNTESISTVIDTNQDGDFDAVIGVSAALGSNYDDFGIYDCGGGCNATTPFTGYGAPIAGVTAVLYNEPNAGSINDLEYRIENFSQIPGFSFTPGESFVFDMTTFAGSQSDQAGEDYIPNVGESAPVNIPGAAELGDYVWEDSNLDGLQTEGGATGIGGVPVEALFAGPDGTFGNADDVTFNTTTGGNGFYLFSPLEPGDYRVTFPDAATIGYADRTIQNADGATGDAGDNNQDSDADEITGETTTITMESPPAGPSSDLRWDAGYYNLATIGDYVWEDLDADGIQNEGGTTGLSGVTVNLTGTDALGNAVSQTTTTDASGFYLFDGLVPGEYQVEFVAPAGYTTTFINQAGGTGDSGDAPDDSDADRTTGRTTMVTLSSGEEDLRWDAGYFLPSQLGDYVWLDLDEDGIQDDNEPGVSGVTVILRDRNGIEIERTTTDANGLYLFDNLPPGDYIVQFNAPPGFIITRQDAQSNTQDALDSDADRSTGRTQVIRLPYNTTDLTWDMGIYEFEPTPTPPPGDEPPPDIPPEEDAPPVTATPPPVSELPTTGEAPFWRDGLMLLLLAGAGALMAGAGLMVMGRNSN